MHRVASMIGLSCCWRCPAGLSAQVVPYRFRAAGRQRGPGRLSTAGTPQLARRINCRNASGRRRHVVRRRSAALATEVSSPGNQEPAKTPGGIDAIATVGGSLAVVLGIFFLVVWLLRRASPDGLGALPGEAFEVLGRAALANRQQAQLLRCGNKLLLVCVTRHGGGNADRNHRPRRGRSACRACAGSASGTAPPRRSARCFGRSGGNAMR